MSAGIKSAMMLVICLAVFASGCSKSSSSSGKEDTSKLNLATPNEALNVFQTSMKNGDYRKAFDCMTPKAQSDMSLAAMFMMDGLFQAGGEWKTKAQAVAEKYGVGKAAMDKRKHSTDIEEDFKIVSGMITDKRAFFVESFGLMKQQNPNFLPPMWDGTLSDVVVKDDNATGVLTQGTPAKQYDLRFKKIGNSWLIDGRPTPRMAVGTSVPAMTAPAK